MSRSRPSPKWMRRASARVRRAPDQQHRRYHELRHARVRPADARVRLRLPARRQDHRPHAREEGEISPDARRQRPRSARPACSSLPTPEGPVALAGVMGGANSEITDDTDDRRFRERQLPRPLHPQNGHRPRHAHGRLRPASRRASTCSPPSRRSTARASS